MMRYELEMPKPDAAPLKNGIATFIAFIVFGFVPLSAYAFGIGGAYTFHVAAVLAFFALVVLGCVRAHVTQEKVYKSALEIVLLGVLAGGVAYSVGSLLG